MRQQVKKISAKKLEEFCVNEVWGGICRYLRKNENGEKVCIRKTGEGEGALATANCQMQYQEGLRPPCKHSANRMPKSPGKLKCKSCGKVRNCEHLLIESDKDGNEVCALCGLIIKAKAKPPTKL